MDDRQKPAGVQTSNHVNEPANEDTKPQEPQTAAEGGSVDETAQEAPSDVAEQGDAASEDAQEESKPDVADESAGE